MDEVANALIAALSSKVNTSEDGDAICATRDDFINLQESNAGFGNTVQEAVNHLQVQEQVTTTQDPSYGYDDYPNTSHIPYMFCGRALMISIEQIQYIDDYKGANKIIEEVLESFGPFFQPPTDYVQQFDAFSNWLYNEGKKRYTCITALSTTNASNVATPVNYIWTPTALNSYITYPTQSIQSAYTDTVEYRDPDPIAEALVDALNQPSKAISWISNFEWQRNNSEIVRVIDEEYAPQSLVDVKSHIAEEMINMYVEEMTKDNQPPPRLIPYIKKTIRKRIRHRCKNGMSLLYLSFGQMHPEHVNSTTNQTNQTYVQINSMLSQITTSLNQVDISGWSSITPTDNYNYNVI